MRRGAKGAASRGASAFAAAPAQERLRLSLGALAVGVILGIMASLADRRRPPGDPAARDGAASPLTLTPLSWRDVIARACRDFVRDRITAVAAGVTFFALLALFPAIGAFVSLYGLFADVDDARRQVAALQGVLPSGAVLVIGDQMKRLAGADHGRLGLTLFLSLGVSIWSSNAGVKALLAGLNIAYEERERRGFLLLNAVSLAFTIGATLIALASVAAVAAGPELLNQLGLGHMAWLGLVRWPLLLVLVAALLSLLYRFGPCRDTPRWRWITPGGAVGALGWLVMSVGFSFYVAHFGRYDQTYGSLGAVVGFMTWIWLSMIVVLFGAELNSELEAQTGARRRRNPSRESDVL
jgi:membrane protein